MKIKKLKLTNFAKFSDIEVVFNDQVTHLVGMNGAGKTTIGLTAIQAGLKGIAEKAKDGQLIGDRFRFIGPNKKSADIFLTIIDEAKGSAEINVHNRITEAGNSISFEAPEGYNIGGNWLNNLLSVAFLSAKNFTQLSTKEQALLLGIDVSSKDKEIAAKKAEITEVNRDIKNIGQSVKIEPAQKVSVSTLLADKKLIDDKNEEIKAANAEIDRITTGVVEFKARREQLMAELEEVEKKISLGEKWLSSKTKQDLASTDDIVKMIESAEHINEKATQYEAYVIKQTKLDELSATLKTKKAEVEKLQDERLKTITSFDFGFDGLDVDEDGGLLLNGRPIRDPYFSKGELEVIVAKLYASKNPDLKVRFIDDFELLDEVNAEKLVRELIEAGFQVITANVGNEIKGENVLLLRDGKIITKKEKEGLV
jgi:hypothetical protein